MASARRHNKTVLRKAKKGDLIEMPRSAGYSHWAVYEGDGQVVHFTPDDDESKFGKGKPQVRRDDFWNAVQGSKAKINNKRDKKRTPFPPDEIVDNATEEIGDTDYNPMTNNCEHFATRCRYGKSKSKQADRAMKGMVAGAGVALGLGLVYAESRYSKKKEQEQEDSCVIA